jgi:hypothetical protein
MKMTAKPKLVLFATALVPLLLIGCGKNDSPPAATTSAATTPTCTAGQVYSSQYGCLAAYQGSPGYGVYNGQAVAAICWSGTTMTQGSGCQPANSACATGQQGQYGYPYGGSTCNSGYPQQGNYPGQGGYNSGTGGAYGGNGQWVWTAYGWQWQTY